ncbi:MAG: ATP-binding protein [Candidatus Eremiobacterota bacterium]
MMSAEHYRAIAETALEWEFWLGPEGNFLFSSSSCLRVTGHPPERFLEDPGFMASLVHPDDRARFDEGWGQPREFEFRLLRADGSVRTLRHVGRLVEALPGLRGTHLDLTDHRERILRERMEAVAALSGIVAHDFNNILSAVLGYASVLREPEELEEGCAVIEKAARRGMELTRKLLDFGRGSRRQVVPVALNPAVEDALKRVAGLRIESDLCPEAPVVEGDPDLLARLVENLGTNAREAGATGLKVRTRMDGDRVTLSLSDDGQGIRPEDLPRIFEPFFTTRAKPKGSGIGLSEVYSSVRWHGGSVEVDSTPGRGTRFRIQLPVSLTAEPAGRPRVLLLEADGETRARVCRMLEQLGCEVLPDDRPEQAQVVILDASLLGILRQLRRANPDLPALVAADDPAGVPADAHTVPISRPIRLLDLSEALSRTLPPEGGR